MSSKPKKLTTKQQDEQLAVLKKRFEKNQGRHKGINWNTVEEKLKSNPAKMSAIREMENTGGEPDVIGQDKKTGEFIFCDCSAESPSGRRSLCYDKESLDARKENKPANNVIDMAASMGVDLLTEEQYRALQQLGKFDMKTSSWLQTPPAIRKEGGAIFGDFRYGQVFVYHNGAQSYYAARGFRGCVKV
jgi:hypothetical protein